MKNKICEFKKNIAHVRLLQTFLTVELVVVVVGVVVVVIETRIK